VLVRLYAVGIVSIVVRVSFETDALASLVPFHAPRLDDGRAFDAFAGTLCADVCADLRQAMVQPSGIPEPEAYTVFCFEDVGSSDDVTVWLEGQRERVAELLTEAAPDTLSRLQVDEVLRIQRAYTKDDLVVIDWDAALVVDRKGQFDDVLYAVEIANLQLEEYRSIDARLDRHLEAAYDDLKSRRFGLFSTHAATLKTLRLVRIDVTQLNDAVAHIGKFSGDWYLARVYLGARERFYLDQWRKSVEDRLGQLDHLYSVVASDVNNRRMTVLEVLIVVFFAIDLVMLGFGHR